MTKTASPRPPAQVRTYRYEYTRPAGEPVAFIVNLDGQSMVNLAAPPAAVPGWAHLSFHKCLNCPLSETTTPLCPAAMHLSEVVTAFQDVFSFDRVSVRVTVAERTYERIDMPVQAALSPLIGLIMATSGCPVLGRLRPQTRFHLPFASELETIARASSLYLLEQYFVAQKGGTPDWQLEGLAEMYRAIGVVNRAFANRLRAGATKDANVNALIRLNTISHALPGTIENQMKDLRFLFEE